MARRNGYGGNGGSQECNEARGSRKKIEIGKPDMEEARARRKMALTLPQGYANDTARHETINVGVEEFRKAQRRKNTKLYAVLGVLYNEFLCLASNKEERIKFLGKFIAQGKTVKAGTDISVIVVRFYLNPPKKEATSRYATVLREAALEEIPAEGLTKALRERKIRGMVRDFAERHKDPSQKQSTAGKTLRLICSDRWFNEWQKITGSEVLIRVERNQKGEGEVKRIRERNKRILDETPARGGKRSGRSEGVSNNGRKRQRRHEDAWDNL